MKTLLLILFYFSFVWANNFEFFDENTQSTFDNDISKSNFKLRANYDNNEDFDSEEKSLVFYHNIKDENYNIDYDIFTSNDIYNINVKEMYYNFNISSNNYLNVGRVNIREGVARSFNPSDYFKGSGVFSNSLQSSVRKDNRLGSVLFQNILYLNNSTLKFIYSPKISTKNNTILSNKEHYGLNFDITNNSNRASIYLDLDILNNLYSSFIIHKNSDDLNFASNLSYSFNQFIFYNENSIKRSSNTISKALKQLNLTNTKFDNSKQTIYQNTFGLSYTSINNIVTNIEYISNNSGMSKEDWKNYFLLINQNRRYLNVRKYHSINEQMISKEQVFLRVAINEITSNSDLSFIYILNPNDKSSLAQISHKYKYKEDIVFNLSIKKTYGDSQSEFGNIDNKLSFNTWLEYYF